MKVRLKVGRVIVQRGSRRLQEWYIVLLGQVTNEEQLSRVQVNDSVRQRWGRELKMTKRAGNNDAKCGQETGR
jgi:hypothetical protein